MRLQKFLNEFKRSSDSDFPSKEWAVIIFDKQDRYEKKGKVHGLLSHAIKHLIEFDQSFFNQTIKQVESYLKTVNYFVLSGKKVLNKDSYGLTNNLIINMLDRINDKMMMKEKLTLEEQKIANTYFDKLSKKYTQIFDNFIGSSVDVYRKDLYMILNLIKQGKTIKVTGKNILYVNFTTNTFAISGKKGRSSLYTVSDSADPKKYLYDKIEKNDPKNKEILKIWGKF